jgi:ABC-2 type transport system ATP-binding protein
MRAAASLPDDPTPQRTQLLVDDLERAPDILPRLAVRDLKCQLGNRLVLDGVSFSIQPGEVVGLLGPNGSGKSTLVRCVIGLANWKHGTLWLDGFVVEPNDRRFRAQLGVVFQDPSLDPHLTARENLELGARLFNIPAAEAKNRADALLTFMELKDRANDRVKTFSGGMKRRLELARGIIHNPGVLVLDEPTTGLDPHAFERTWRLLKGLQRDRNLTVLVSTHGEGEAAKCDKLVVLDGGKVVAFDTPAALLKRVSGDILVIESAAPDSLAADIAEAFELTPRVSGRKVLVEATDAHALVPRIVELFPPGTIDSIQVRRPTLADAFLKLTGRSLDTELDPAAEADKASR